MKKRFDKFKSHNCLLVVLSIIVSAWSANSCRSRSRSRDKFHDLEINTDAQRIFSIESDTLPFMAMEATPDNSLIYLEITSRLSAENISLEPAEYYHMLLIFNVKRSDEVKIRKMLTQDVSLRKMLEPFISDDFKFCAPN